MARNRQGAGAVYRSMKRHALTAIALALVYSVALSESQASTSETRTLEGQYRWYYQDDPGRLRAEFTRTGQGSWDVEFHFRFDGRERTYTGTAEGEFAEGEIEGKVRNENGRRTFTFEGAVDDDGRFRGTHAETTRSRARRTGTLVLRDVAGTGTR